MAYENLSAFEYVAGRSINKKNEWDIRSAIQEISDREGWIYYSVAKEASDPTLRLALGLKKNQQK